METYGGMDVLIHIFLTLALVGGRWPASRLAALSPRNEPPVPNAQKVKWARNRHGEERILDPL
jgi:hypothetical protein